MLCYFEFEDVYLRLSHLRFQVHFIHILLVLSGGVQASISILYQSKFKFAHQLHFYVIHTILMQLESRLLCIILMDTCKLSQCLSFSFLSALAERKTLN